MNDGARLKRFYLILTLGLLTAIGPLSIDIYLPAFPAIASGLSTTVSKVMLSLSSFFIGISAGQLLYGPLLERYGRKKPLYAGLFLYLVATAGCALTQSVNALVLFRFLQALGGCAGMVSARAIVRDIFKVDEIAKIFSTLMLVVAISPIIAPTLGGYITAALGWRYVFGVLLLTILAIIAGVFFLLPESKKADPGYSLKPVSIIKNFRDIFIHPSFLTYALSGALAYAGLYAYISGSPYVFMELYHVNEKQYGWIFAFIAMGIIGSSQVNTLLLRRFNSVQVMRIALSGQFIIGVLLVTFASFELPNVYILIFLIFLFLCSQGFTFPNSSALTLAPFASNAGTASALMGAIQLSVGAAASALVSITENGTALPMTSVMASCSTAGLLVFLFGRAIHRNAVQ